MFKVYKVGELENFKIKDIVQSKDTIDFAPVYQRYGNIWDSYKQKLFIDTILNNYDVPKFYFNYFIDTGNPLNKYNKIYAVIDGKQRLETILNFVENKFPLDAEFKYYDDADINIAGKTYSAIAQNHPDIITKFLDFVLDIIFIATDDEERLEDMFLRLNGGEALTNAEKRNAIGGEFNKAMRTIVESDSFFINKLRFTNRRYQHQDLLTKLVYLEYNSRLISLKPKELNDFVRENKVLTERGDAAINSVRQNLNIIASEFEDKDPLLKGKGVIPVYYFFITRHSPDLKLFRQFLTDFEILRIDNKRMPEDTKNAILVEYDRHNQQAVHTERSLNGRLAILDNFYSQYRDTKTLSTNVETDINLNEDED